MKMPIRKLIEVKSPSVYETTDLYLSAHLMALGVRLIAAQKMIDRYVFQFQGCTEAQVLGYRSGAGQVSGRGYADSLKSLKSMMRA
jgi:hypothetical protein